MNERVQVVVIGASGFGRESLDVIEAMQSDGASVDVGGVVDDSPSEASLVRLAERGVNYLGKIEEWISSAGSEVRFVLGIGNPVIRRRIVERLEKAGLKPLSIVHPNAIVGTRLSLDEGAVICAGAVISTNVKLGKYVHVNPNATIGHDAVLGDFVSVNPGAVVSGEVIVDNETLLGAQSTILQGIRIGENTVVGAMSCVTKNVASNVIVKGIPARE